jgi:hypothetical protein
MSFLYFLKWKMPSDEEGFGLLRTSGKNFAPELNASSLDVFSDRLAQLLEKCEKHVALKRD